MTGAENLMNTVINSLSMIDKGFTVTLTVQPHNWEDNEDYDDDDDEEEPHVSDDVIENIKEFAHRINEVMSESVKSQMLDHCEGLLKEKYSSVIRSMGDDVNDIVKDKPSWPSVGDTVWYKTKRGNFQFGKVKVVCHNTIQLDNNIALERRHCIGAPFEIGDEVWFDLGFEIRCGYVELLDGKKCLIRTKKGIVWMPYVRLFDSVDELFGYLKSTADE